MSNPRAKTAEEIKDELLHHFRGIARYWAKTPGQTVDEKCMGVAFSILATLDGCTEQIPAFDLVVNCHQDDPEYLRKSGLNWYEPGTILSFALHEEFHRRSSDEDSEV